MLIFTTSETIRHGIHDYAARLPVRALVRYAALIETEPIAWLFVIQPGDTSKLLTQLRSQPFDSWEYVDRLDGWYEAVFIVSDDGFGHVVLVPDQPEIDQTILTLCREGAAQSRGVTDD